VKYPPTEAPTGPAGADPSADHTHSGRGGAGTGRISRRGRYKPSILMERPNEALFKPNMALTKLSIDLAKQIEPHSPEVREAERWAPQPRDKGGREPLVFELLRLFTDIQSEMLAFRSATLINNKQQNLSIVSV